MVAKSIPEQIIDDFIGKIAKKEILEPKKLFVLKEVLNTQKPKKADILKAIKGDY